MIMKAYHIQTWGGGTPHYLVIAPTKEEAWKMVEREWRKLSISWEVGGDYYRTNAKHQTIDDLVEIENLTSLKGPMIIDLHEDWKKQKNNNFRN